MGFSFLQSGRILMVLRTDKSFYYHGEPVIISLFTLNIFSEPIAFTYPTSQRYDLSISTPLKEIWRWSIDRVFLPVIDQIILLPGQSLSYSMVWPQVNNHDQKVPPGLYRVTGWNTFEGFEQLPRPSTFIRIQDIRY